MTPAIRAEAPGDAPVIGALIAAAFAASRHGDNGEAQIVDRLRAGGELAVSLLAERDGVIVGHVAFSPVTIADGAPGWFGLGPVAVQADARRQGIGAALIEAGLAALRSRNAAGCVVLGDPRYYARFGFTADPALAYQSAPREYFQALVLAGPPARGVVRYGPAFGGD